MGTTERGLEGDGILERSYPREERGEMWAHGKVEVSGEVSMPLPRGCSPLMVLWRDCGTLGVKRIGKEFRDGLGSAKGLLSALCDAGPDMSWLPPNVHIEKRSPVC